MSKKLPSWGELEIGFVLKTPGSSTINKTGSWRTFRPVIDYNKCTSCGFCWAYCPEPAVEIKEGKYVVNYDYCKGCGICASECPVRAISMAAEEE